MTYRGLPASPGFAMGEVLVYDNPPIEIPYKTSNPPEVEQQIYNNAVAEATEQIETLRQKALLELGEDNAAIFEAHAMMLADPTFESKVLNCIKNGMTAAHSVSYNMEKICTEFDAIEDPYLQTRSADLRDVCTRIIKNMLGIHPTDISHIGKPIILVAYDLTPSDTAQMDKENVLAIVSSRGSRTSHTAIMARTLDIPAVVGLFEDIEKLKTGDTVIVDGIEGYVSLNPDEEQIAEYQQKAKAYEAEREDIVFRKMFPAETEDFHRIIVEGNIGSPDDVAAVIAGGGEAIGLYRTEFLYMNTNTLPDESTQTEAYRKVITAFGKRPVTIRTLDIGGDKQLPYLPMKQEMNPFLGQRAIRLCAARPDIFKTQLRAILRASVAGRTRIMFPMISGVEEVLWAKSQLKVCMDELSSEGVPYDPTIEVGVMIEVPSAAITVDLIAPEVDFFSIGTNDLCQYTMAADRMNADVAHLNNPAHTAILRMIKYIVRIAHKQGHVYKNVGVCGEMAGSPEYAKILLGLGVDELSMNAPAIPVIKNIIRKTRYFEEYDEARILLQLPTDLF